MKETEQSLISIGLTPTEAKIYLAGLVHESLNIQDLAKYTKIKRPTIYHAIETLIEKGLVAKKKLGNKSQFTMTAPENIRGFLERQRDLVQDRTKKLETLIPFLELQQKSGQGDGTSVVQYDGIEGMKTVLDMAFYCKSKRWDIIAPIKNFLREFDRDYALRYLNARKYHDITSRTLWEPILGSRTLSAEEIEERNPRFMPTAMQGKFKSMMILFDDKIAVFSSYDEPTALLITSKELSQMFLAMFQAIWALAEKYK